MEDSLKLTPELIAFYDKLERDSVALAGINRIIDLLDSAKVKLKLEEEYRSDILDALELLEQFALDEIS